MQAVCDDQMRIRHAVIGYPGSVHDARIYSNCDLAIKPEEFFDGHQWIAGDSAYRMTNTVLTPFRANSVASASKKGKFNKTFSKHRIKIEHTFSQLKERFGSLKELRLQLKNDFCVKKACIWILTCVILHNVLIESKESDLDIFKGVLDDDSSDDLEDADGNLFATDIDAETKRNTIINLMKL